MSGYCKKHNYPLNVFGGCLKCDGEEKIHSEFCSQAILEYRKTVAKLKSALAAKDKRIDELEKSLAEEKRECVEGWRRWKILKDKP